MSKSTDVRDQIVYSRDHIHVQCGWNSRGIEKVGKVGRGFLCQAQAVKIIPTLWSHLLNSCKESDFGPI